MLLAVDSRNTQSFRSDINALRAWAVVSVMLYHFQIPGFSGGFSGVDIFFVISGFLMTKIVINGAEGNRFSLIDFYIARANRIFPALAVLCAVLLLLGWVLLAPDDYSELAKHTRDSLLFYSNNTYRKEAGYFDVASHDKWLLHTWSLSVEWQFYLILPIIIMGIMRLKKSADIVFSAFAILAGFSFVAGIMRSQDSPDSAFYSLKYRCWEMLFGGAAYFLSRKELHRIFSGFPCLLASVLLMVAPVFLFNKNTVWPGWKAMFTVTGAFLFIVCNADGFFSRRLSVLQWLGSRSYSIYLWHWPFVVLLGYFEKADSFLWVSAGIVVSILAGWASYRWVEIPAALLRRSVKGMALIFLGLLMLVFVSMVVMKYKGFPDRVSGDVLRIMNEKNNINSRGAACDSYHGSTPVSCAYGGKDTKAIVIGDSHANALVNAVVAALASPSDGLMFWGRSACPFIIGAKGMMDEKGCTAFNNWVMDKLKQEPRETPVILISRFSYYALGAYPENSNNISSKPKIYFSREYESPDPAFMKEFREASLATICELSKIRDVYMIKPIPEMRVDVPKVLARDKMKSSNRRIFLPMEDYYLRHSFFLELEEEAKATCGVKILDPIPYLCDQEKCFADDGSRPFYSDDDHLSEYGNKRLIPMFSEIFR